MAAVAITPIEFAADQLTEELHDAAADGNLVNNYTGKQWFEIQNDDTGAHVVTFNSIVASNYGTDVNLAVTVAAGARKKVKLPAPATRWRNTNGAVEISYDGVTDLKIGIFKWPE